MEFKEVPKHLRDELRDAMCQMIEQDLRSDPKCPAYILAGLDVAKAVRALQDTALELVELGHGFIEAENTGRIREIEQYAKLVTAGIKQYVAAMKGNGGAP